MFNNVNENAGFNLKPGVNKLKVSAFETSETNWKLTFSAGEFKTNFLGNFPYVVEENQDKWANNVDMWAGKIKRFFRTVIGDQVDVVFTDVSNKVAEKYTDADIFGDLALVKKMCKYLLDQLFKASVEQFKELEFNVVLCNKLGLDKEGNEKWFLNIPTEKENGYKFPFSLGEVHVESTLDLEVKEWKKPTETTETTETTEVEPDWVNNSVRKEPVGEEW